MITTLHDGQTTAVLSTLSQAAAPRILSTSLRSGLVVMVKLCPISQEKGHVPEFEDADADCNFLACVCIWRSVPSKGQNHMLKATLRVKELWDRECSTI